MIMKFYLTSHPGSLQCSIRNQELAFCREVGGKLPDQIKTVHHIQIQMVPDLDCLFVFGQLPSFIPGGLYFLSSNQKKKKINHLILLEVKVKDQRGLESIINTVLSAMLPEDQQKLVRPLIKAITPTNQLYLLYLLAFLSLY